MIAELAVVGAAFYFYKKSQEEKATASIARAGAMDVESASGGDSIVTASGASLPPGVAAALSQSDSVPNAEWDYTSAPPEEWAAEDSGTPVDPTAAAGSGAGRTAQRQIGTWIS